MSIRTARSTAAVAGVLALVLGVSACSKCDVPTFGFASVCTDKTADRPRAHLAP